MATFRCPDCNNKVSEKAESCPHCGRPLDAAEAREHLSLDDKANLFATLVVIALLVGGYFWLSGDNTSRETPTTTIPIAKPSSVYQEAYEVAKVFVKNRLVASWTADFPPYERYQVNSDTANTWVVTSYVDSENEYGIIVRAKFRAKIKSFGKDKWKLSDLRFYE